MTRSEELDAAVAELEEALVDLKAVKASEHKSRIALRQISASLGGICGRIARITTGRYYGDSK